MQPQPFRTEELKTDLEARLGFVLASLERLDGASALNFKAVRASDGFAFAVKCWTEDRCELFELTKEHLVDLKGSMAVQRIFEAECPEDFAGCKRLCVKWCPGVRRFPDTLSDDEYRRFLDDSLGFFSDLQRVKLVGPVVPLIEIKRRTLARCRGVGGWILRKVLEAIPDDALTYRKEFVRNIHSDFHHGNFLFDNGRVAGFMDLEEIRKGYPTEDMMRYLVCAKEHLRWYAFSRVRRIRWCFREAVRRLPYTEHEWMLGIAARFMIKVEMNTSRKSRIGVGSAINLWYKGHFYKALLKDVVAIYKTFGGAAHED